MRLAVFGHYDSRGGTTAIPIPDVTTREDVKKAFTKYNEMFYWEESLKEYRDNPDAWKWNPTEPGSSPAENDFLFLAQLHAPADAEIEGDLQEAGAVIIKTDTEVYDTNDTVATLVDEVDLEQRVQLMFVPYPTELKDHEAPIPNEWFEARDKWQESLTHDGWEYRNWNDDAFGFMIGTGM